MYKNKNLVTALSKKVCLDIYIRYIVNNFITEIFSIPSQYNVSLSASAFFCIVIYVIWYYIKNFLEEGKIPGCVCGKPFKIKILYNLLIKTAL